MADRQLKVTLLGDARQLDAVLGRTETKLSAFGKTAAKTSGVFGGLNTTALFAGAAGGAGFFAATAAAETLGSALKEGVSSAAQLQKSGEAIDAIFGKAAGGVKDFAANAANIGISAEESQRLSVRLGILSKNLGIAAPKAAEMAVGLQELAGSIAEIRGIDPATVLENLPQALAGNLRSLKQLGFAFSQAQIKAEALSEGILKSGQAVTPAAKAQAIYALVTKNLAGFQDQAARNAGDFTNQQHKLAAETDNLKASVGKLATGPLTALVTELANTASGALKVVGAFQKIAAIKIPTITIPFTTVNVGGDTIGDVLKQGFKANPLNPLLIPDLFKQLTGGGGKSEPGKPAQAFLDAIDEIRAEARGPVSPGRRARNPAQKPIKQLPFKLQEQEIDARLSGSAERIKKVLQQEADFLGKAISAKDSRLKPKERQDLKQALLSVTTEIQGINQDAARVLKDNADKLKSRAEDIKRAREAFQQSLTELSGSVQLQQAFAQSTPGQQDDIRGLQAEIREFRKKLAKATSDSIRSQIISQITEATAAIKQIQTTIGETFKQNVLDKLQALQSKVKANRDLEDARKALKVAKQIGGPEGIKLAQRDVQDALLQSQITKLEQAKVTGEGKGTFAVTIGQVHLHGIQNAKQLLAELQRLSRTGSAQSRGNHPGTLIGHL